MPYCMKPRCEKSVYEAVPSPAARVQVYGGMSRTDMLFLCAPCGDLRAQRQARLLPKPKEREGLPADEWPMQILKIAVSAHPAVHHLISTRTFSSTDAAARHAIYFTLQCILSYAASCVWSSLSHLRPSSSPFAGLKPNAMITTGSKAVRPSTNHTQTNPPVRFVIAATSSGPVKEHVRLASAYREKKADSYPCPVSSAEETPETSVGDTDDWDHLRIQGAAVSRLEAVG